MRTLVVSNQKGGVGKTATVVHLAYYLSEKRGLKVTVIDLDTQGNASFSLSPSATDAGTAGELFQDGETPIPPPGPGLALFRSVPELADMERIPLEEAANNFMASLQAIAEGDTDICLIDTAPSLGNAMASAMFAADFVLSPIELEVYSIQGIEKLLTLLHGVRQANAGLRFLGMLPSKVDSRNKRHSQHLAELRSAYPDLLLPAAVPLRTSIAEALASQIPVWRVKGSTARKAGAEVLEVMEAIAGRME